MAGAHHSETARTPRLANATFSTAVLAARDASDSRSRTCLHLSFGARRRTASARLRLGLPRAFTSASAHACASTPVALGARLARAGAQARPPARRDLGVGVYHRRSARATGSTTATRAAPCAAREDRGGESEFVRAPRVALALSEGEGGTRGAHGTAMSTLCDRGRAHMAPAGAVPAISGTRARGPRGAREVARALSDIKFGPRGRAGGVGRAGKGPSLTSVHETLF